jgi:hypothetical protein
MPVFNSVVKIEDAIRRDVSFLLEKFSKQLNYKKETDFKDRIGVWADTHKFNYKMDESIWKQHHGEEELNYSIYFDGVFICNWDGDMTEKEAETQFYKGFLKAYKRPDDAHDKIFLDKMNYKVIEDKKKKEKKQQKEEIIKAIKSKPVETDVQAEAKEIALDVANETSDTT